MKIFSIDPGPETSGACLFDTAEQKVLWCTKDIDNEVLRSDLIAFRCASDCTIEALNKGFDYIAIETIEPMGLGIGKSTINTAIWVGRLYELAISILIAEWAVKLVRRGDEKIMICGCKTFVDPVSGARKGVSNKQIRQALIDRFPPTGGGKTPQVGTKKKPGPLYGVTSHAWSALAIAITCEEQLKDNKE